MLTSGDIVDLDLGLPEGREAGFCHPALVVTAQRILDAQPTVIHVVPLTTTIRAFTSEVVVEPDDAVRAEGAVVVDGAMGTTLYARGIFVNRCFDELNLSSPNLVKSIHEEYLAAGAEVAAIPLVGQSGHHTRHADGKAARATSLATAIRSYYDKGARFLDAESGDAWGPYGLGYYVASRVMWDVDEVDRADEIEVPLLLFQPPGFSMMRSPMITAPSASSTSPLVVDTSPPISLRSSSISPLTLPRSFATLLPPPTVMRPLTAVTSPSTVTSLATSMEPFTVLRLLLLTLSATRRPPFTVSASATVAPSPIRIEPFTLLTSPFTVAPAPTVILPFTVDAPSEVSPASMSMLLFTLAQAGRARSSETTAARAALLAALLPARFAAARSDRQSPGTQLGRLQHPAGFENQRRQQQVKNDVGKIAGADAGVQLEPGQQLAEGETQQHAGEGKGQAQQTCCK